MSPQRTNSRKKPPLVPAIQIDGKPVCPGCRIRGNAVVLKCGLAIEQPKAQTATAVQLALDDYLGEELPAGKYKFIAKCDRCGIRFSYTKDV